METFECVKIGSVLVSSELQSFPVWHNSIGDRCRLQNTYIVLLSWWCCTGCSKLDAVREERRLGRVDGLAWRTLIGCTGPVLALSAKTTAIYRCCRTFPIR